MNISRLQDFQHNDLDMYFDAHPIGRGVLHSLTVMGWNGTASTLIDALVLEGGEKTCFRKTVERLGYACEEETIHSLNTLSQEHLPCFIKLQEMNAILLEIQGNEGVLYDYKNDIVITCQINRAHICRISQYSRLFHESSPQLMQKDNWVKSCFYKYGCEIKAMLWLSFFINLLAIIPSFYIMSVYNFALNAESVPTLLWLSSGAVLVALLEMFFKQLRGHIMANAGQELSVFVAHQVLSKLLWLPYSFKKDDVSLSRLRDIDQIRSMVASSTTIHYFDLPFIAIYLLAIFCIAGTVAIVVLIGVLGIVAFCYYARFLSKKVGAESSQAHKHVQRQWHDLLINLPSIQGLPIMEVIQARFRAAQAQNITDAGAVASINTKIGHATQMLVQVIGATSIVAAVFLTMHGQGNPGSMLAIIILIWKVLTPTMHIYSAIAKFQSFQSASKHINTLMSLEDNRERLEKSTPIKEVKGHLVLKDLTHRYPGASAGLTQLNCKIEPGQHVAITGSSGCGKTTLLNIIAGINEHYQGSVLCDSRNIRQFNNFYYRKAIKYIPLKLYFFDSTFAENIQFYNGAITLQTIEKIAEYFQIMPWIGDINKKLSSEFLATLPNGIQELLRLCIGLGNCQQNLVIIDEPLLGCATDFGKLFTAFFNSDLIEADQFLPKTVIYTTNEKSLLTAADNCLLLNENGSQKYFGFPDKVLEKL